MAKAAGRLASVKKNAVVIGGVRVSNITVDNTMIDVTDNDSAGIQELLADYGLTVLSFDVEGIYTDAVLRTVAMTPATSKLLTDLTFTFSDADVLSGDFFLLNYSEGNDYKESTTFKASFTSSGAWAIA